MSKSAFLIFLIRLCLISLFFIAILFIFSPSFLHQIAERMEYLGIINFLNSNSSEWVNIKSLIAINLHIYIFLLVIFIAATFSLMGYSTQIAIDQKAQKSTDKLSKIIFNNSLFTQGINNYFNKNKIKSIIYYFFIFLFLSYIGFDALHENLIRGGLISTILNLALIEYWCYLVFLMVTVLIQILIFNLLRK